MTEVQHLIVFLAAGAVGAIAHWVKKWARGEIDGGLIDYLFRNHARESVLAMMTFGSGAVSLWLAGQLDELGLRQLIVMGFLAGYTVDSSMNRGALASLGGGPGPTKPLPPK